MNAVSVQELALQAVDAFHQQGYTEQSIEGKEWVLLKIVRQHEKYNEKSFSPDIVEQFVRESEQRYENGEIQRIYYRFLTKTATYLTELHSTGSINFARRSVPTLPNYYKNLLDEILAPEDWSVKGRRSVWVVSKTYFGWLSSNGYSDFSEVDESVLWQYLIDCASQMKGSSLDTVKWVLKKLCAYLYNTGIGVGTYERLLTFSVPIAKKIKRPVPHAAVLIVIDRGKAEGRRDYAMILMAAVTGLRAIDIAGLKFGDVDWRNGEIRIIQSKTEESLALPLTTDVGMAIQDYILNGRPKSELENVFLRANAPFRAISRSILYGQFNSYREKVGLPKCSFHGLRRALGSNMVISATVVTTVAQVLGHSDIDSTKQYISLDTKHLKECALDFSGIAPKRKKVVHGNEKKFK